jgi:hypothetical protein
VHCLLQLIVTSMTEVTQPDWIKLHANLDRKQQRSIR